MSGVRLAARLAALLGWLLLCVPLHLLSKLLLGRSPWPRRFLAGMARLCGARVRTEGGSVEPHTLLVSNHVSWLDIPVLSAATGCAFVAKAELQSHPLVRWLADQNQTMYVDRADRQAIQGQAEAIRNALRQRQPLAIFPEGTVGRDGAMLPFRPSLLSAVAPAPPGTSVRPVAIDYGAAMPLLAWAPEEGGVANALKVLRLGRPIGVTVHVLPPLSATADRKALAAAAQQAVAGALAASGAHAARL